MRAIVSLFTSCLCTSFLLATRSVLTRYFGKGSLDNGPRSLAPTDKMRSAPVKTRATAVAAGQDRGEDAAHGAAEAKECARQARTPSSCA